MVTFWILWIFNALMSFIPVYFFFVGLQDGSVGKDNMSIWVLMLAFVGLVIGGTYWLKTKNQVKAAKVILILTTIPCLLAILFLVFAVAGNVRWN